MSNLFTERAQRAIHAAQQEAARRRHDAVEPEHLLLALLAAEFDSARAAGLFNTFSVDRSSARARLERTAADGNGTLELGDIPFSPRMKQVLANAVDEAHGLGHRYFGTEHLLLALLHEDSGVAVRVLEISGLHLVSAREALIGLLGEDAS